MTTPPQPPPPAERSRPVRGPLPMVLSLLGGLLVLGGLVLAAVAVMLFLRVIPAGVLDLDGSPGADVVASAAPPGEMRVELEEGETWTLYLAAPTSAPELEFQQAPTVTGPSGESTTMGPASTGSRVTLGDRRAIAVHSWTAGESGEHLVTLSAVRATDGTAGTDGGTFDGGTFDGAAQALLVPGGSVGTMVRGIVGTVGSVFAGVGLLLLGTTLLIVALIVALVRRSRREQLRAGPGPMQGPPQGHPQGPAPPQG